MKRKVTLTLDYLKEHLLHLLSEDELIQIYLEFKTEPTNLLIAYGPFCFEKQKNALLNSQYSTLDFKRIDVQLENKKLKVYSMAIDDSNYLIIYTQDSTGDCTGCLIE